jgi:hypothetical protein
MIYSAASFGLYYEEDGVYLELYEERGRGDKLDRNALSQHVGRKRVNALNPTTIQTLVAEGIGRAKIAPPQQEYIYGEDMSVEVSSDEYVVSVKLLEPEPGGAPLELETAKKRIASAGVTHGLNEQALEEFLAAKVYNTPRVVAEATPPQNGEDGKLIFHFSTDERTGRPREIGGGRVDYRTLDLFIPVTEGQLLVTRTSASEGVQGTSVKGRELKQKHGKEVNLPRGKNVDINAEKTEMRAMCSGMVEFMGNSINVSSVYKVDGDCDISVGNIDFDGSVHISGNVKSGHVVKATGTVVVGGVVEAATVIAGGNIEVKSGMQGADKGRLEASGSIAILYIERGTAVADGTITVDVSIHSKLEAGSTITAKGQRGAIIGGYAGAADDIIVKSLGAASHARTDIEVGVMPRKRSRIQNLEKEMEKLASDMIKLDQLDAYLKTSKGRMEQETWEKLYRSGIENRKNNEQYMEEFTVEINALKFELEHATESRVHVSDVAHPGTRITIGSDMYKVNDDTKYATFRYSNGQVVWGVYELT